MGFTEAIKTFYARYTDFSGRSSRSEFWWVQLCLAILTFLFYFGVAISSESSIGGEISATQLVLIGGLILIFLGHLIGLIALQVRRFHDLDKTGWLVLVFGILSLIPLVGTLVSIGQLIWFCFRGTIGGNQYGPDPLGPDHAEVFD